MAHLSESCIYPPIPLQHFKRWGDTVCLMMKPHVIPLLQLGSVRKPWKPTCFLASSFQAFSEARKFVTSAGCEGPTRMALCNFPN